MRGDDRMPSPRFEAAVEAVVDGALAHLQAALRDEPGLVAARSHWGHRATLLHYVADNGVEIHRQRVPAEAVAIARTLLDHGADPTATAPMYGRQQTTLGLLRSSGHPHAAGLTDPLAALLRDAGG